MRVDVGVYEWAIEQGFCTPKKPHELAAQFISGVVTLRWARVLTPR